MRAIGMRQEDKEKKTMAINGSECASGSFSPLNNFRHANFSFMLSPVYRRMATNNSQAAEEEKLH